MSVSINLCYYTGCLKLDKKIGETRLATSDHTTLLNQMCEHAAKWKDIGTHLGFSQGELRNIQANPMLFFEEAPRSYLNYMLSEWLQWAPGDARGSAQFATLQALRSAMNKVGLAIKGCYTSLCVSTQREQ